MGDYSPYDDKYSTDGYYYGKRASKLSNRIVELVKPSTGKPPWLLDLGCGEGRDAVYLAGQGFRVTGVDTSAVGLAKMAMYARDAETQVTGIHCDMAAYKLDRIYDVILSIGALHYVAPQTRRSLFERCKQHTAEDGLNAFSVFIEKPFLPPAPDPQPTGTLFRSGELMNHYWDWEIVWCEERIVHCQSGGISHQHAICDMIARKLAFTDTKPC